MNNQLADLVLNYLLELSSNPAIIFPLFVWVLAVWRVFRLRPATNRNPFGISPDNFQDYVTESVAETVQEQIADTLLQPLFHNNNIQLPHGRDAHDVVEMRAFLILFVF